MAKKKKAAKSRRRMAKKKNAKSRTMFPHKESAMGRLYGATVAWLRHLAAALRHALARAGAAVACNAAVLVVNRNRVEPFEGSYFFSATSSAPRLTPNPETLPPLTGAENRTPTLPPSTGANNSSTPPTGANNVASGSQASGPACVPASNSDSSPPNSGSQASGSASAPASNSRDTAPRLETKPATASPRTGAKNSDTQASGSDPGPASAPRLAAKRATLSPPTGAKTPPSAGTKAHGFAQNRGLNQEELFSDGYHLNSLFEEDECHFVVEDDALIYARFCSKRAISLLDKNEICHICYFLYGKVSPCKKEKLEKHCQKTHATKCGFPCEKQGCFIRTSSLKEAGRHHLFCHEKPRDWWVKCLRLHGEM